MEKIKFFTSFGKYIEEQINDLIEEDKNNWGLTAKIINRIIPLFSIVSYYYFKKRVYQRHTQFALTGKYEMGYSQPFIKSIGINLMLHKSAYQERMIKLITNTIGHEALHLAIYEIMGNHIKSKKEYDVEEDIIKKLMK